MTARREHRACTMTPETSADSARSDEDEAERLDRELIELLNELRVVMPGVQVLFGFLLTVPFQQRFDDDRRLPARRLLRDAAADRGHARRS